MTAPDEPDAARAEAAIAAVERAEGVRVLFAVEAGSRAMGFPAPGSDLDIRLVHVHPLDWYITVRPRRDVVERLGEGVDLVGWDIRKAVGLLVKPNPSLAEWLASPVRYRWDAGPCEALARLCRRALPPAAFANHYLRLCGKVFRAKIAGREEIAPKHVLYAARAALALARARAGGEGPPPAHLPALVEEVAPGPAVAAAIAALVSARREGAARVPRSPVLDAFVEEALASAPPPAPPPDPALVEAADDLLRAIVKNEL